MAHYLVVAHQTVTSPDLLRALKGLVRDDPSARLTLLIPATPVEHLLTWTEGETREVAKRTGEEAASRFRGEGIPVEQVLVGDASPVDAVADAVGDGAGLYDQILVSTFPPGISRWLGLDAVHRIARRHPLPVTHVVCEQSVAAKR